MGPYLEHGDLAAIKERGQIRFIVPSFDQEASLPGGEIRNQGVPVLAYQALAEEYARSLNLRPVWVYVETFDDLMPALMAGRGDVVVTNFTHTRARAKRVSFSRPLAFVNEVLISRRADPLISLVRLAEINIAIGAGTAYQESLDTLSLRQPLNYTLMPSSFSDADLMALVANHRADATVMDSDAAVALLRQFPDLMAGPTVRKNRHIAWAVRKDSRSLLDDLNLFLPLAGVSKLKTAAL